MPLPTISGTERVYTTRPDGTKLVGTAQGVVAGRILVQLDEPFVTMAPDPYNDGPPIETTVLTIEVHERDLRYLDAIPEAATPQATYIPEAVAEREADEAAARTQAGLGDKK